MVDKLIQGLHRLGVLREVLYEERRKVVFSEELTRLGRTRGFCVVSTPPLLRTENYRRGLGFALDSVFLDKRPHLRVYIVVVVSPRCGYRLWSQIWLSMMA